MKKILITALIPLFLLGCDQVYDSSPTSKSGIKSAKADIQTQSDGLTIEQSNIKRRLENDNKPGSIKHLYVISPFSGDVLIYSSVRGKVTSSGKRLTTTVRAVTGGEFKTEYSPEVIQDDGTYGSSTEYLYFWDQNDIYRQIYVGGCLVVVSDQPINVKPATIRFEK